MKSLITGAGGFVGTHLQKYLSDCGDEVFARDTSHFDIRNFAHSKEQLAEVKPDVIYHLAGLAFVPECENNFLLALEVNVNGTENILRAAREVCPSAVIVLVSSGEVYGSADALSMPVEETETPKPVNNYSLSKLFAEKCGQRARQVYGQKTVIMRPFNHIGPGQSTRFAIASFAEQLADMKKGKREAILRVGNLSAKRDLTDVRDIVRGYRLAAMKAEGLFNLCTGTPVSIQRVLDLLIELSGMKVEVEIDPSRLRPSDTPETRGSFQKAKVELGWEPKISLEESLKDCFEGFL